MLLDLLFFHCFYSNSSQQQKQQIKHIKIKRGRALKKMRHHGNNDNDSSDEESFPMRGEEEGGLDPSSIFGTLIKLDFHYAIGTWFGRVKLLQLIFSMLAGCLLPSAIPGVFFTRFAFYTFVIWTCFMYIFVDLFAHVTSLSKLLPDCCRKTDIMMYPLFIGALTLLLICSLVASVADISVSGDRATRTGFSVAFGFMLMLLFLLEAFLHYKRARNDGRDVEITCFPISVSGRSLTDGGNNNSDIVNGNTPPRGGRNIVISRPTTAYEKPDQSPPPYHETTLEGRGGGLAVPLGTYGVSS